MYLYYYIFYFFDFFILLDSLLSGSMIQLDLLNIAEFNE